MDNCEYKGTMLSLEQAFNLMVEKCKKAREKGDSKSFEWVPLWEAGSRILAEDIVANEDVPDFDRSPLDGYAVRSVDTNDAGEETPVYLKVIDTAPAGHQASEKLDEGMSIRILTGGPLPEGADAVIRQEEVSLEKDEILVKRPVKSGEGVAPKGEEVKKGETVLYVNELVGASHLAMLASVGVDPVKVKPRPKVGIFCTGEELLPANEELTKGKIRVTNLYALSHLVREAGGEPVNLGLCGDKVEDIKAKVFLAKKEGLDLLVSTGGVSSGDYDLVQDAMQAAGAQQLFWKVAVRPGAPVAAAMKEDMGWLALSGSPGGVMVMGMLLLAPLVATMGDKSWQLPENQGILAKNLSQDKNLLGYLWASCWYEGDDLKVSPLDKQYCGSVSSYLNSNCLLEVPAGRVDWPAGKRVTVRTF